MNQAYYEQWNEFAKTMQEPMQAFAELNVKTLQDLTFLKPEDFTKIKKPEEMLEKQIDLAVKNGHKTIDYLQKSFEIFEKGMISMLKQTRKSTEVKK